MRLLLRKSNLQARIEGFTQLDWGEDDYVILDGTVVVGRIYRESIHGEPKWRWFLQTSPAPPPNQGMANTLDEAEAGFKRRYEQVKQVG
jgi:hypothetical protein